MWVGQLQQIVLALGGVYSSCVTAQLALLGQNAEQDCEIMRTLRMTVAEPVSRQAERLEAVVRRLRENEAGEWQGSASDQGGSGAVA